MPTYDLLEDMPEKALAAAAYAKGSPLTNDEIKAVRGLCGGYALSLINGLHPRDAAALLWDEVEANRVMRDG